MEIDKIRRSAIDIEEEQLKVLAFDLFLEWQRIHEPIYQNQDPSFIFRTKKRRFLENVATYAKEACGMPVAQFPPYRIERENEQITLYADGYKTPIREAYNPDSENPNLPWPEYRLGGINYIRARLEYKTFSFFEKSEELSRASEGDIFVWISMPPTDILFSQMDIEEKKKALEDLGYGFHTNTFAMIVENGFLQGNVIQNYLNPEGQRKLLKTITGRDLFEVDPNDLELLGRIVKVENESILSVADIKNIIDEIYADTCEEKKFKPYNKGAENWSNKKQMEIVLEKTQPILKQIFYLLYYVSEEDFQINKIRELIDRRFTAWENIVSMLLEKEEVDFFEFKNLTDDQIEDWALSEIAEIKRRNVILEKQSGLVLDKRIFTEDERFLKASLTIDEYAEKNLTFGGTGCGIGSGFGSMSSLFKPFEFLLSSSLTYKNAELLINESKSWSYHKGNCVVCNAKSVEVGPCNICKSCEKEFD